MSFLRKLKPDWREVSSGLIVSLLGILLTSIYTFFISEFAGVNFRSRISRIWNYKTGFWILLIALLIILVITCKKRLKSRSTFTYEKDTLNVDRNFFNRLRYEYITQEMMMAPRMHYFSDSSFEKDKIDAFLDVQDENQKSDFEFLNPKLEELKNGVFEALGNMLLTIRNNVCGTSYRGWLRVPSEWSIEHRARACEQIHLAENDLCLKYDELIRQGRRVLKI